MASPEYSMPADKLPTCWSDEVRMNALFAPFRVKSANPESWAMKMKFWSDMLRQWCRHKNDPVVSATDVKVAFLRRGRTPACIDIVVEECLRNGDLVPMSKYHQALHSGPEGWISWGARLAFKPAAIAATAITFMLRSEETDCDGLPKASIDPTQRFVLESAVKEQAIELLHSYPVDAERLGTVEELMQICGYPASRRESFEVLLGYLVAQGLAVKKEEVIKLAETSTKVSPITDSDEALHKLLSSEKQLLTDAEKFHREAERALEDARVSMKMGNKIAAKNHLRRKHKCLERAAGSEAALENVRQILSNMKQMEVNSAVVDTYRMSAEAMKKGMTDGGLSEDSVFDTMDELREVLDSYNDVEKALAGSVEDYDVQELEEELSELLSGTGPTGGTPKRDEKNKGFKSPTPQYKGRKEPEGDFVFDGEERILAELNDLSIEDKSPEAKNMQRKEKEKIPVYDGWNVVGKSKEVPIPKVKPSKLWYPPQDEFLKEDTARNPWMTDEENNMVKNSLDNIYKSFNEVRLDERLHPGQRLDLNFKTPPRVYTSDFQVQDHKLQDGVWLFNSEDRNQNSGGLQNSTEYYSFESPGKTGGTFQMAPGGERKRKPDINTTYNVDDLERRLQNLRGFNL